MEELQHSQDGLNKVLTKLRHIGWILTFISLLTDVSHQRAFPSHNIIIGVSTCYCGTYTVLGEVHQSFSGDSRHKARFSSYYKEVAQLKKMLSALILLTFFSLMFDVIFCITWGGDILTGDYKTLKFSLYIFILNMLVKPVAIFYASQIVSTEYPEQGIGSSSFERSRNSNSSHAENESYFSSDSSEEHDIDDVGMEMRDAKYRYSNSNKNSSSSFPVPLPPPPPPATFSPGIPGLVSPVRSSKHHFFHDNNIHGNNRSFSFALPSSERMKPPSPIVYSHSFPGPPTTNGNGSNNSVLPTPPSSKKMSSDTINKKSHSRPVTK